MAHKVLSVQALCACVLFLLISGDRTEGLSITGNERNVTQAIYQILNILTTIETQALGVLSSYPGCSQTDGFFFAPGTGQSQCLKGFINAKLSWEEANAFCQKEGLTLARPYNAQGLALYLYQRYNAWNFWVNARGDGANLAWESNSNDDVNTKISNSSPLWWLNEPGKKVTSEYCLQLLTNPSALGQNNGKKIYFSEQCTVKNVVLCETIIQA